ncbi:hypothetical protein NE237_015111 [Protea cynaroides]|uniref:Uncharacterized protein n=1 Tax=Protea cynaroides TaxID=273540 RepID=A0A9Q0QQL7_9MAGN|nr:hypothetical protein NE237_015111 [Protea cynaroides]
MLQGWGAALYLNSRDDLLTFGFDNVDSAAEVEGRTIDEDLKEALQVGIQRRDLSLGRLFPATELAGRWCSRKRPLTLLPLVHDICSSIKQCQSVLYKKVGIIDVQIAHKLVLLALDRTTKTSNGSYAFVNSNL